MKTKITIIISFIFIIFFSLLIFFKENKNLNPEQVKIVTQKRIFELSIKNRKITSGTQILQAKKGEYVTIKATMDESGEIHIHGYDKKMELEKNIPGEISFKADLTGRFPFEIEESKTDLGILEVSPE